MTTMEDVSELLTSVIMSQKGGVLLKNMNRDFISLAGEPLPYKKLGFKSIEELLKKIPEINKSLNKDGEILYTSTGKNCDHLAKLISSQKGSNSKSLKPKVNKPRSNEYFGEHHARKLVQRDSTPRAHYSANESEIQFSSTSKNKYDFKIRHQSNAVEKMGLRQEFTPEKDCNDLRRKIQRNRVEHNSDKTSYDSYNYDREIHPFDKFVNRNTRHDNFQKVDKSSGISRHSLQYAGGSKSGNSNYDTMLSDRLHESQALPSIRHKDYRRSAIDHHPNFSQADNNHIYHKGSVRQSDVSDKYPKYHDVPKIRRRYSHDTNDLECYGRESFNAQRSSSNRDKGNPHPNPALPNQSGILEYHRWHSWESEDASDLEDYNSSYTDRKFDLVSGILRITIKN